MLGSHLTRKQRINGGFSDHFLAEVNPIPVRLLAKFMGGETLINQNSGIHFHFNDYLELLDFTGRAIVENKTGHIDNSLPSILQHLNSPTLCLAIPSHFNIQTSKFLG